MSLLLPLGHLTHRVLRRVQELVFRAMRGIGLRVLAALPLSDDQRQRFKMQVMNRLGPILGRARTVSAQYVGADRMSVAIPLIGERYMDLACSAVRATGTASDRSISVVLTSSADPATVRRCITALDAVASDIRIEVILADGNTANVCLDVSEKVPLRAIDVKDGTSRAERMNAAVAVAQYPFVLLLDPIYHPQAGCLQALLNTFELHAGTGLVCAKLLNGDGTLVEAGRLRAADGTSTAIGADADGDAPEFNFVRRLSASSQAAVVLPTSLFNWLHGAADFATSTGHDLEVKVHAVGLQTVYQPLAAMIRQGPKSLPVASTNVHPHSLDTSVALPTAATLLTSGTLHQHDASSDISGFRSISKILVVDQITPEPDRDAGSITTLEIMRVFKGLGMNVTFAPVGNPRFSPPYTETLAALGIRSVLAPWDGDLTTHLEAHGSSYDAIMMFRVGTAKSCLPAVDLHAPQARKIFHPSDLHFLREKRERELSGLSARDATRDPVAIERDELDIIDTCDVTIVHSTHEHDVILSRVPGANVQVFGWVYEAVGSEVPYKERKDLVFLGGYRHLPNVDAAKHFARNILPLVRQFLPTIKFVIVGSDAPPEIKALANDHVEVVGFVETLDDVLGHARVMVAPLRYGAGIKGKIISAMAHGLPVVTSDVGAEGMGLVPEKTVLIANDEAAFADAVVRAYGDAYLWQTLADASIRFVEDNYSRARGLEILSGLLSDLNIAHMPAPFDQQNTCGSKDRALLALAATAQSGAKNRLLVRESDGLADLAPDRTITVAELSEESGSRRTIIQPLDETLTEDHISGVAEVLHLLKPDDTLSLVWFPPSFMNGQHLPDFSNVADAGVLPLPLVFMRHRFSSATVQLKTIRTSETSSLVQILLTKT